MKKIICLLLVLTISCVADSNNPPLVHNAECQNICWLGVNPGVTIAKDAELLLRNSSQINQISDQNGSGDGWWVKWNTGNPNHFPSRVGISVENGLVESISFSPYPQKIGELIKVIGYPEEISIKQQLVAEGVFTSYTTYFLSKKSLVYIAAPIADQPSENDIIDMLIINIDPDSSKAPKWVSDMQPFRQPWLGFGHLDEYLKNRPSPLE